MAPVKVETYVVGSVQTNCYFAINEETRETLIIDPGASAGRLAERLAEQQLNPEAILLTHGHFDHAGGAAELAAHFGIKVYAHERERETLDTPSLNLSGWGGGAESYHVDEFLKDEQEIDLAGFHIRVFHTPGHTEGGCCFYFPYQNILFSGDTLFHMSVGRTDFPRGSMSAIVRSIREKILPLPEQTRVYPGHNDETTVGTERMYNPYL